MSASSTVVVIATIVGDVTNEAFVSAPGISGSSDTATVTVNPTVLITMSADETTIDIGEAVTFFIEVENIGSSTSTAVTVTDVIPPQLLYTSASNPKCSLGAGTTTVTCSFDDIGPGGLATSTIIAIGQAGGTANNVASVKSDSPFPDTLHSTASSVVTVTAPVVVQQSSSGGGGGGGRAASEIGFRPMEGFQFEAIVGGENPEPQKLVIWTTRNRSVLRFKLSADVPWIDLDEIEGISDSPGDKERIDISVDISGLDAGTHVGTVTISGRKARNDPQQFQITLVLEEDIPEELDELVELLEAVDLDEAVVIVNDFDIEKAAELTASLDSRRAADIMGRIDADAAGSILSELGSDSVIEMLKASDLSQLQKPLSEMAPADFMELVNNVDATEVLLEKLPLVSAEQLLPVQIASADPDLPAPVATETGPSTTIYDVASVSPTGWTRLVGSPGPIDNILARFSRATANVQVEVEILGELPKESPGLGQGRLLYAAFKVEVNDVGPEDIEVAQVTLSLEKEWVAANGIHRWSIELSRYDEEFESWSHWNARLVDETSDRLIYVAAVPGFSTFAVTGKTSLADPEFVASNLRVLPPSGIEGQRMIVTLQVANIGSADAVFGANLWIDGALVNSKAVEVPSGEEAQLTFTVTESVGNHSVRVGRLVREFEVRPKFNLLGRGPTPTATAIPTPKATAVPEKVESPAAEEADATPTVSPTPAPVLTSTPVTLQQAPSPTPTEVRISPPMPAAPLPPEKATDAPEIEERLGDVPQSGAARNAIIIGGILALAVTAGVVGLAMNRRAARMREP
ncbi:MAG: PGF-pre-PGF domain-containing protein [Chloroflexi bacterium]|nr:PGF-pre-PGF domain-containing protein [Chloroflexota bacterium]